jgi:hypothetical protein
LGSKRVLKNHSRVVVTGIRPQDLDATEYLDTGLSPDRVASIGLDRAALGREPSPIGLISLEQ